MVVLEVDHQVPQLTKIIRKNLGKIFRHFSTELVFWIAIASHTKKSMFPFKNIKLQTTR